MLDTAANVQKLMDDTWNQWLEPYLVACYQKAMHIVFV
jgi:hypothetical protein